MIFLKRSNDYKVIYKKKQAAEELMNDDRVDYIENKTPCKMIIHTKPIIPITAVRTNLILAPIGNYTIELSFKKRSKKRPFLMPYIIIEFKRKQGVIKDGMYDNEMNHVHINKFSTCWGNAETDISMFCKYKDWYWTAKTCLNLLEDFHDKNMGTINEIDLLVKAQINYMNDEKFTEKIKEKTKKVLKRNLMKEYNKCFKSIFYNKQSFVIQF